MLKRIVYISLLVLFVLQGRVAAQSLKSYEYWFDEDYASKTVTEGDAEEINLQIDVADLSKGIHFYNFRALNTDDKYSAPYRYLVYIPEVLPTATKIASYEYWLDEDYDNRQTTEVNSQEAECAVSIDISGLESGIHFYNFRAMGDLGDYSAPYRYLVYIPSATQIVDTNIASYEYWFDNDYDNMVTAPIAGKAEESLALTIDASSLSAGIHFYNFRAKNASGDYSAVYTYLVYIPEEAKIANTQIASYEYWMDNDYANKTSVEVHADEVSPVITVDVSNLEPGVHFYNFRAMNEDGNYSAVQTSLVYIPEDAEPVGTPLVGYQYAFNNVSTYIPIPEREQYNLLSYEIPLPNILDVAKIGDGCTFTFADDKVSMERTTEVNFGIQFKNKAGKWSIPETYSYTEDDQLEKTYTDLAMDNTVQLAKVAQGDFQAVKMVIPAAGTYYLCSNQSCCVDIYKADGTLLVSVTPQEMQEIYALGVSPGTYYGIVYNTIQDEDNKSAKVKVKLSTTDDGIKDDIEGMEDTDITLYDDVMYMENDRIVQGCSKTIPVLLNNSVDITQFSFDLILPEGITVAKNSKGKNLISLDTNRKTDSHAISSTIMGDGTVSVKCISADEEPLNGNSGTIVYITLDVAEDIEAKEYAIALDNIKLITDGELGNTTELVKSTIKILRFVPGDVDMDEELTKADADGISRCIINKDTEGLNIKAADANQDGVMTIQDIVFLISKILTQK